MKNKQTLFNPEDDQDYNQEKQGPLRKPPSSVRKMISAFETSSLQVFCCESFWDVGFQIKYLYFLVCPLYDVDISD